MNTVFPITQVVLSTFVASFSMAQTSEANTFLDRNFWTPTTSIEIIKAEISKGNDLAGANGGNFDAFYFALNANVPNEVLKFIVDYPGNGPHKITHDGRTNLFWSAYKGNVEMVQYFLKKGAKIDHIDEKGLTPFLFAINGGVTDIALFDVFLKNGSKIKKEKTRDGANAILLAASHASDLTFIDYLAKKGAPITSLDADGNGIIEYAMMGGNIPLSRLLIKERKAKPQNNNAVLFAATGLRGKTNKAEVYTYIKEELQLPLSTTNSNKQNALHIIAGKQIDLATIKYITNQNVDLHAIDNKGNTVLHYAAKSQKSKEILGYLKIKLDEEINKKNDIGATPIHYALEGVNPVALSELLTSKEQLTAKDNNGNDYITYLAEGAKSVNADLKKTVEICRKNGLLFESQEGNKTTLMHLLAQKGDHALVSYFVENSKCDINKKNDMGLTPIHIVAMNAKSVEDIIFWIELGANPKIDTDFEETTYQLATENELLKNKINALEFIK